MIFVERKKFYRNAPRQGHSVQQQGENMATGNQPSM